MMEWLKPRWIPSLVLSVSICAICGSLMPVAVLAVGVASKIRYGPRRLLFNCAVPGYRAKPDDLRKTIGPTLVQLVNMADRQVGLS